MAVDSLTPGAQEALELDRPLFVGDQRVPGADDARALVEQLASLGRRPAGDGVTSPRD
ncbi:hypothetical protein [Nocardioides lijunqiniae]|uniref:hypothetical protein n=1 Tax=Nocardioides lijunqiniae TaxID=2760832 RepID=UPI0018784012|nr:hypothetical protein [Nocardioides lijunqiniae]